jgi:quinol monooxygenase YgiN
VGRHPPRPKPWKDEESLAAHEKAAHFVTLVPKIQSLASMKLEKFSF